MLAVFARQATRMHTSTGSAPCRPDAHYDWLLTPLNALGTLFAVIAAGENSQLGFYPRRFVNVS